MKNMVNNDNEIYDFLDLKFFIIWYSLSLLFYNIFVYFFVNLCVYLLKSKPIYITFFESFKYSIFLTVIFIIRDLNKIYIKSKEKEFNVIDIIVFCIQVYIFYILVTNYL